MEDSENRIDDSGRSAITCSRPISESSSCVHSVVITSARWRTCDCHLLDCAPRRSLTTSVVNTILRKRPMEVEARADSDLVWRLAFAGRAPLPPSRAAGCG